jgi:hypothetical protein
MQYRYKAIPVSGPKAKTIGDDDLWFYDEPRSIEVLEQSYGPEDTGLVDQFGDAIVKLPVKFPCGFIK